MGKVKSWLAGVASQISSCNEQIDKCKPGRHNLPEDLAALYHSKFTSHADNLRRLRNVLENVAPGAASSSVAEELGQAERSIATLLADKKALKAIQGVQKSST